MRPTEVQAPSRLGHLSLDGRGYPVIVTIPQDSESVDFGAISEARKLVVATFDLCAVCGRPFNEESRWLVTADRDWRRPEIRTVRSIEAPTHEICALYAAQVCPFVSSPFARLGDAHRRGQRRGQRRAEALVLVGFERTVEVAAVESMVHPGKAVLSFSLVDPVKAHVLDDQQSAVKAYTKALRSDLDVDLDDDEQGIVDLLTTMTRDGEDSGVVMAGAAWMIGAAFCPRAGRVSGLRRFGDRDRTYAQISTRFLLDPDTMDGFEDAEDPATAAAVRWFRSRSRLPAVLSKWRADERIRRRRAQTADRAGKGRPKAASKRRHGGPQRRKQR